MIASRPVWIWLIAAAYLTWIAVAAWQLLPALLTSASAGPDEYRPLSPTLTGAGFYGYQVKYLVITLMVIGVVGRFCAIVLMVLHRYGWATGFCLWIMCLSMAVDGNTIYLATQMTDLPGGPLQGDLSFRESVLLVGSAVLLARLVFGVIVVRYLFRLSRQQHRTADVFS